MDSYFSKSPSSIIANNEISVQKLLIVDFEMLSNNITN